MSGTSAFPTGIDTFNNPGPGNSTGDPGYYLDVEISKLNDAALSLETQLGISGSAITSTIDYILKHHTHQGTDNSSKIALLQSQASGTDGPIFYLKNLAGNALVAATTASGGPTFAIAPATAATVPLLVYQVYGATQTADLQQWTSAAAVPLAGVDASGGFYTTAGFKSLKGVGGLPYRSSQPTLGEIDYPNGAMLKGYSGAVGTGQQYQMDMSQGALQLGGPTATASLVLNAWKVNRTAQMQMIGKDNADAGTMAWNILTDADGQIAPQARTLQIGGQVANRTTGVPLTNEPFMAFSYPTYDGVSTFTKAAGISVMPGVAPGLAAGYFGVNGGLVTTGAIIGGSTGSFVGTLGVTGLLTASAGLSAGSQRVQNVATPTTGTDAPNVTYLVANYEPLTDITTVKANITALQTSTATAGPTALTKGTSVANFGLGYSTGFAFQQGLDVNVEGTFNATAAIAASAIVATLPAGITKPTSNKPINGTINGAYGQFNILTTGSITTQAAIASGAYFAINGSYIIGV